jgi:hypothetical protein
MGQVIARREQSFGQLLQRAQEELIEHAEYDEALRGAARQFNAAIPAGEPLNATVPLPDVPVQFTAIGSDGTQIPPDRHGLALYYLINVGSLVYRHGSGQTPQARSVPHLFYREEDLYEGAQLVSGNLLDVQRDRAELEQLADLVEAEPDGPVLALVDGTLLLWVLEELPAARRRQKIEGYLQQLERVRERGAAAVAAYTSRPRYTEVGRLLHLVGLNGDLVHAGREPNPFERLPDGEIFSFLPPGARSALFISPKSINQGYYAPEGHEVHYFYVNVAREGEEPVVARVEVPAWGREGLLLDLVHGGVVGQSRIAGGFPYVLARADELAYVSGPERQRLEEMVGTALLAAGAPAEPSSKALYKSMTRRGRRWR